MRSLIIGGTVGFGLEVSKHLVLSGYDIITIGRSRKGYLDFPHFVCDVGDLKKLKKVLVNINQKYPRLDSVFCVAGFFRGKIFDNLTISDWHESFDKNLIYIALAFSVLKNNLLKSNRPGFLTIGSQWSIKLGPLHYIPYVLSKHALKQFTKSLSLENPKIKINHYCVPTMDTPQLKLLKKSFEKIGKNVKQSNPRELGNPKIIARGLVSHSVKFNKSGHTLFVETNGKVRLIE